MAYFNHQKKAPDSGLKCTNLTNTSVAVDRILTEPIICANHFKTVVNVDFTELTLKT